MSTELCDLPDEMLSAIAERLGYIDLVMFSGVCKRFLGATCTATAEIESTREPWFLAYGRCEPCYLVSNTGVRYALPRIPELGQGAICLASSMGWLLVMQSGGSMSFIHPFTCARERLPDFPCPRLCSYCTAAFSSPPWSRDCIVAVVNRFDADFLELNVFRHGRQNWTTYHVYCPRTFLCKVEGCFYYDQMFYFFGGRKDRAAKGFRFCPKRVCTQRIQVPPNGKDEEFPFHFRKNYSRLGGLKKLLGLSRQDDTSISTCGTVMSLHDHRSQIVIYSQFFRGTSHRVVKGVWLHPRYTTLRTHPS